MVEWKKLGDLGSYFGGLTGKTKEDFVDGNAKFITYMNVFSNPSLNTTSTGTVRIGVNEKQNKLQKGDILFTGSSETPEEAGMSCVVTKDLEGDYYMNSFCFGIRVDYPEKYNLHYLKYILRSNAVRKEVAKSASGVTRFNISKSRFGKIQIPIPSLSEQERIVGILDTFTASIDNIKAQIEQRRKQYEHYRNTLLTFNKDDDSVEWKTLEDIFELRNGYTPSKANPEFWTDGTIPWFRMEDIRDRGRVLSDSYLHITESAIKGKGLFKANSFILATTATIGEHALLIADSLANQQFTNLKIRKSLINNIAIKFMYYYMFVIDEFCKSHTNVSGFASVDMNALKRMLIPIPSLARQQEIVSILDTFEASINNLEAQLEQRQKQYEYYREKLLTFE